MKNKLFILILIVCNLLTAYVSGEVPPAKVCLLYTSDAADD